MTFFPHIKSRPPVPKTQATRDLTRHEREARRLAMRNAAAVAAMVDWLGADYCLAKPHNNAQPQQERTQ